MSWEIVIGLETHTQLLTRSKIFSGASTAFGAAPNTQASGVDIALPGVLPVLNATAVEFAHFQSEARNLIVYMRNRPSTVRATNVSRASIQGDELSVRLETPGGLALSAAATSMRAVDRGRVRVWYGKR